MAQNNTVGSNVDAGTAGTGSDNYYQISDDDLDECEDLGDDCLLEEVEGTNTFMGFSGRGPYERAWTTEATRALIHIRGPMEGRFTEGRQKRTALWLHCTRQLQKLGYRYNAAKVQKKWHNILITYNKNIGKKYQCGYVHWEFFEDMFKYLQGKKADFDTHQQQQPPQQQQQLQQIPQQLQIQQHQKESQQHQPMPQLKQYKKEKSLQQQQQRQVPEDMHMPYMSQEQSPLLQPKLQIDAKSNDEFDEEDSTSISELKQPKLEYNADNSNDLPLQLPDANDFDYMTANGASTAQDLHSNWWKDYFERKLLVEREKIQLQRDMHRDLMQFNKMSLVQQEKIERVKIDAINNLTSTLQKLVEVKRHKT